MFSDVKSLYVSDIGIPINFYTLTVKIMPIRDFICKFCFKKFKDSKHKDRVFCSRECSTKYLWSNNKIKSHWNTWYYLNCIICNNKFYTTKSSSKQCSSKYRLKDKKVKHCIYCNNEFTANSNNSSYCSKICWIKNRWKNHKNKIKPSDVLDRKDMKFCSLCGYDKYPEILERHHIDRDRNNNNKNNLLCLCPNCHCEIHLLNWTWKYHNLVLSSKYLNNESNN